MCKILNKFAEQFQKIVMFKCEAYSQSINAEYLSVCLREIKVIQLAALINLLNPQRANMKVLICYLILSLLY